MRRVMFGVAVAILSACSSPSDCGPTEPTICAANRSVANAVAGAWTQLGAVNGIALQMNLAAHDTTLVGTASNSIGSGSSAAAQVTGFVFWSLGGALPSGVHAPAQPIVVLDITFGDGSRTRMNQARLVGRDTLKGVLNFAPDPNTFVSYGVSFVRTR